MLMFVRTIVSIPIRLENSESSFTFEVSSSGALRHSVIRLNKSLSQRIDSSLAGPINLLFVHVVSVLRTVLAT